MPSLHRKVAELYLPMSVHEFVKISRAFDDAYPGATCKQSTAFDVMEIWIEEAVADNDPRLLGGT